MINTGWLRNCKTPEQKKRITELVGSGGVLLDELAKIILAEVAAFDRSSVEDYANPGWALLEADRKGQVRFARKMLELIDRKTNA